MTEHSAASAETTWPHPGSAAARETGQWTPGAPWPDPRAPTGETTWVTNVEHGHRDRADGMLPWGEAGAPARDLPPVAGASGPHTRPGWLEAGRRVDDGPDAA